MTTSPKHRSARRALAVTSVLAAAALALTACSSGSSAPAATTAAAVTSAPAVTDTSSASASAATASEPATAAELACDAYFELDLLNSNYAGGAVEQGDLTEEEVKAQFKASLKDLVAQAKAAAADGSADAKLVKNAKKMKKEINALSKKQSLSDLTKKEKAKFAKQSTRVQKACMAAGFDLPVDNVTARTAANL